MSEQRRNSEEYRYRYRDNDRAQRSFEEMRRRSTSGKKVRRMRNDRYRISREEFIERMKIVAASTAVATTLLLGISNAAISTIRDIIVHETMRSEFQVEILSPETHRTNDGQGHFYDYEDIAQRIENSDNYDDNVFFLYESVGDYQTNLVLEQTKFGSFTTYLESRGYSIDNLDEYKKQELNRLLKTEEVKKKEDEIEEMLADHPLTDSDTLGGKQI